MAENVLVITATKRLMSQKLSTTMQTMKKKHETKNSESIIEYIIGDHCSATHTSTREPHVRDVEGTDPVGRRHDDDLQRRKINRVEALDILVRILLLLNTQLASLRTLEPNQKKKTRPTHLAHLPERAYVSLGLLRRPVERDVPRGHERPRIDVPATLLVELDLVLPERR